MENDTPAADVSPKPITASVLLVYMVGELARVHERLDKIQTQTTPPPPPKWYIRAAFWILDWRSTIVAGIAMIPWRNKP